MVAEGAGRAGRASFIAGLGFQPDHFQIRAMDAIDAGDSVLVAAPTGSGKTVVGEYVLHRALAESGKAFYTTPIKALSNQKFTDFSSRFGAPDVGLLTGDNSIRGEAPVVVMTTEVLRNMLYARSPTLDGLRFVVLDEVHYLENAWRGPVWEEVIIHTPPDVQLVCLSATVSNAEEVGAWLRSVRSSATVVIEERRPVELTHFYLAGDRATRKLRLLRTFVKGKPNPRAAELRKAFTPRRVDVLELLADNEMLPAIYFIFSRAGCDEAVRACRRAGVVLTDDAERRQVAAIAEARAATLTEADREVLGYDAWLEGLMAGVASHHAGQVPPFKEAVEICFAAGLVKAVFATETLALGINMPAKTVVIENLSKFTGERHELLRPGDYTQLTGRAGRRGIDTEGNAVVLWSPYVPFAKVAALASNRTYELTSAFRPTYNMAANLVRRYTPDEAHHVLDLSFAQFRAGRDLLTNQFDRVLQLLERWGYVEGWHLTPAGESLAQLSHECDLLLAEAMGAGLFDDLDPATLAGVASAFTYETRGPEGSGPSGRFPNAEARKRWTAIESIVTRLNRDEEQLRLPLTRRPDPGFVGLAHAWASGEELGPLIATEDITGGDFVRNVKQLVDLLRQLAHVATTPETAGACSAASTRLFRGVVAASNLAVG